MDIKKLQNKYLPLTEAAYYILISLNEPRHGYGIMQHVEKLTNGRIKIGAGTMYGNLSRMEKEGLITSVAEEDRKKIYGLSEKGKIVLKLELERLEELIEHGKNEMRN
ncbi:MULTISPECIES: PadR family transcriptional regulator [Methanobacterium]|jgi:DNA-binding PadR family transcriptional regulator|uniref:PadR family transcriptional regulator n=1 Tax=Methanobacterium bryantii TaxID=2161 RepID=A0A2A2H6B3_METBR|nr:MULTISPECIES: PadR family transcriptional regulator [Methanobacterium]OEC85834.1 PadR family transcriptional regulator [Methanobacterium sp. A39]PAV05011.1 PadR family transcriptional regulator [Methanobacterium bryantii]